MADKDLQHQSTEEAPAFQPTTLMVRWFETALELGHTASISEIAEKSGVDRTTWYVWLKDLAFVEWWDSRWQQFLKVNRWKLDAMGMRQAERNYDYWRTMMERTGNIETGKAPGVANQVNINLGDADFRRIVED